MPRPRGFGKGPSDRFNIRLEEEEADFYRKKANEHGVSISVFLRHTLVQGVIAENVAEIERRLKALILQTAASAAPTQAATIPDEVLLSIFTSEALLAAIVEARDIQQLYAAQDRAKARLNRFKAR